MHTQRIQTNGIELTVSVSGPQTGPLLILLHGFPQYAYTWRYHIPMLAALGYRVLAPDLRGYNTSDKPASVRDYAVQEIVADVVGLIDSQGREQAFIVGHDWGAVIAWRLAAMQPQRIARMVVINVPHGAVMRRFLRESRRQLLKSWYVFFFQIPWLPEWLARQGNWFIPTRLLLGSSRAQTFSDEDLAHYRQAWSQPGAYRAMLNWYRAFVRYSAELPSEKIAVPTLLIWGAQDRFLSREMAQPSIERCRDGRLVLIEDASHWVHEEEPQHVGELIASFFSEPAP